MTTRTADVNRLALQIQRMLDAELLLDAEGATLLAATAAARLALEAGDPETARRHIEQITRFTEAVVTANPLALKGGCAVLEAAEDVLNASPDAGNAPC